MKFEFTAQTKTLQGNQVEAQFLEVVRQIRPDVLVITADTHQNRREHWDYMLTSNKGNIRVDVKSIKKCGQNSTDYTVLEIFDVAGRLGWLYGEAEYIAFQSGTTDNYVFILTPREKLINYHLSHTINERAPNLSDAVNKLYTRNQCDLITIINMQEILPFSQVLRKTEKIG